MYKHTEFMQNLLGMGNFVLSIDSNCADDYNTSSASFNKVVPIKFSEGC